MGYKSILKPFISRVARTLKYHLYLMYVCSNKFSLLLHINEASRFFFSLAQLNTFLLSKGGVNVLREITLEEEDIKQHMLLKEDMELPSRMVPVEIDGAQSGEDALVFEDERTTVAIPSGILVQGD